MKEGGVCQTAEEGKGRKWEGREGREGRRVRNAN